MQDRNLFRPHQRCLLEPGSAELRMAILDENPSAAQCSRRHSGEEPQNYDVLSVDCPHEAGPQFGGG